MQRFSLLFTILAVLCAVLVVEAIPGRVPRPSRPSRPTRPSRPPVVTRPRPPVVVHRPPVVVHKPPTTPHRPPVVVHRPTTPGGTHPPQHSPLPSHAPTVPRPGTGPGAHSSSMPPTSTHPTSPPARPTPSAAALDAASGCPRYDSCDECVRHSTRRAVNVNDGRRTRRVNVSCAWLQTAAQDHGSCVSIATGISHPRDALSSSAAQCTALYNAISERYIKYYARQYWSSMADHTFYGDASGRPENGRHLVSSWLEQFPDDNGALSTNTQTQLAKSTRGKTLWMDTAAPAPYTGHWTQAEIRSLCVSAIEASIREHIGNGRQTPDSQRSDMDYRPMSGHHAYSVRSPRGGNICVDVFDSYSCFPAALTPTNKRAGQKCGLGGQMLP